MCIVFNPSPFDERLKDIDYNMISYLLINEVEAKGISGLSEPEEALTYLEEKYKSMKIVLTLGSKGCIYFDGKEKIYQSAYKVEVKDTTAAGDTFTGYFVSEISKSTDVRKALQIASAASAIAVSREGAAPSIPLYEETKEALENFKKRKLNNEESLEDKIKDYIEENIKTADINELAQKLGYTTVYTGVLVKKITGYSFTDFVKRKRCSKAAKMLVETTMPIQQIINEIGYENQSFFRKMFKEKYGETPLKYRKNRE
jgi:YesN/AraC family two-component response regulator